MLPRIKTLPLPVAARLPQTGVLPSITAPAAIVTSTDGAVAIVGDGREAEHARAAVRSLRLGARTRPQVVLATPDTIETINLGLPHGASPVRVWMLAGATTRQPGMIGVEGVAMHPVTPRMVEAFLEHADIDYGIGADGSRPTGRPARSVLVAASVLDDADRFVEQVAEAFSVDECKVWMRDGGELRPVTRGDAPPSAARLAADSGLPVVVDDGNQVTIWVAAWCTKTSADEATGLIALCRRGVAGFGGNTFTDLDLIAMRLAVELSWLRVHRKVVAEQERLRAAAMLDALTGAWTRAAFERTVEVELAGARRRGEVLAMVVFDVDGLRRINDEHGHSVGDAVLAHATAVIRANVRVNDEVGRIGDDELAVVLMGSDLARSIPVAEKLVRKVLETPLVIRGERIRFSVRAGVTGFARSERAGELAIARAMRACDDAAGMPTRVAACDEAHNVTPAVQLLDEDAQVGTAIGATIGGGYRILHEINRGANGVVYRGEDIGLGRPVAIKVLRHDLGRDEHLVAHFRREASILASLRHPNLVEVYAFGAADDVYFVMELVEGPTAADLVDDALDRSEWLDVEGVAEVISEIGDALETMHAAGLVHCDVKPDNIVLDRNAGRAVLVDVGECKRHDEARRRAGTPGYAAPESFAEGEETAAIDVYSLAATAYMMLTSRLPYGAGDALSILARQLDAPPPPPSTIRRGLPAAADVVLLKAMSIDPTQRFTSPAAFAVALRSALRKTEVTAGEGPVRLEVAGQLRELTVAEAFSCELKPEVRAVSNQDLIRGAAFRVAAKVLAARAGEPWLRRLAEHRRDLAELLAPTLPPMSWHPVGMLLELVGGTTVELDVAEVLRTIGRGMVSVTFGHLYGADPSAVPTRTMLASVPQLWARYFGLGQVEVIAAGADCVVLGVIGSVPAAELIAGFLERIAELTGATGVHVSVARAADRCSFTVAWIDAAHAQ